MYFLHVEVPGLLLCMFNFLIVMYVPFSVFCVLFVRKCELYCCHWVSIQLRLNVSYHITYFVNDFGMVASAHVIKTITFDFKLHITRIYNIGLYFNNFVASVNIITVTDRMYPACCMRFSPVPF
jgi:hypothetical protein